MGVARESGYQSREPSVRFPHIRGGGPLPVSLGEREVDVFPTYVGVARRLEKSRVEVSELSPHTVGVNQRMGGNYCPHSLYRPYLAQQGPLAGGGYPSTPTPV